MEKYLSAVREMYSQFKQKEAHPMEKYVGKLARCTWSGISEVVGYSTWPDGAYSLIVESPKTWGDGVNNVNEKVWGKKSQ